MSLKVKTAKSDCPFASDSNLYAFATKSIAGAVEK